MLISLQPSFEICLASDNEESENVDTDETLCKLLFKYFDAVKNLLPINNIYTRIILLK